MKNVRMVFVLLLVSFYFLTVNAQNKIYIYDGPYDIFTWYQGGGGTENGFAEYEYKNDPDGGRLFEGLFEWRNKKADPTKRIQGIFKNNRMIDRWEWLSKKGNGEWQVDAYISFNNNGIPDGPFSLPGITGEFKNGKLYGKLTYYRRPNPYNAVINLIGYYDTQGKPCGVWDVTEQGERFQVYFDDNGKQKNCGYRDKNNDWIWVNFPFPEHLSSHIKEFMRECYLLRTTKKLAF